MKKLILSFSLLFTGVVGYAQKYITYELTDGLGNKKPYKFEISGDVKPDSCQNSIKIELFWAEERLKRNTKYRNSLQYTPNDNNIVGRIYVARAPLSSESDSILDKRITICIKYKAQNDYGGHIMDNYFHVSDKKSCKRQKYEEEKARIEEEKRKAELEKEKKKWEEAKKIWDEEVKRKAELKQQEEEKARLKKEEVLKKQNEEEARLEKEEKIRKKQIRNGFIIMASIVILPTTLTKIFYKEKP
jgi:hypothetical protein